MNYTIFSIVLIVLSLTGSSKPIPLDMDDSTVCDSLPSDQSSIRFYLYTKTSSAELTLDIDSINAASFADSNKLVVYLHGFAESASSGDTLRVRDAYLNGEEDLNVVLVDYSAISAVQGYTLFDLSLSFPRSSYCYVPRIADQLVYLISLIQDVYPMIDYTHLVGLSLGAQIAGKAGKRYKEITGRTLDRVTALDAAGTNCFEKSSDISQDSAIFVDALHTNIGWFGMIAPVGHVDVYLNNAILQPICMTNATDVTYYLGKPSAMEQTICSHMSSVLFFVASIINNNIHAQPCDQITELIQKSENIYLLDTDYNNAISLTCGSSSDAQQIVFGQYVPQDALGTYYATVSNILELLDQQS